MKQIIGGAAAARGFEAASAAAGIKYSGRDDMALIYSEVPCKAAGTFTSNIVKAAPVKWDHAIVEKYGVAQAIVINSGIANACTGEEGMKICKETAEAASKALSVKPESVLVASTGVIGAQIPMNRVKAGVKLLAADKKHTEAAGNKAAKAIMTTDTIEKEIAFEFTLSGKACVIGGMCKGSGMIHPNMCTMLAFITTDAAISEELLKKALKDDIQDTFNMVSVDGDTSTNDTALLLANGLAGNPEITEEGADYQIFCKALKAVNTYLAKKMAGDGEGATALLEIKIINAVDKRQAVTIAKSVVSSSLVKTAIAGHDANWGRILCAMGYSGAEFDPEKVDLFFESAAGRIQIMLNGVAADYSEKEATRILSESAITVTADIKMGCAEAVAWGCDLTHEYININADYRS